MHHEPTVVVIAVCASKVGVACQLGHSLRLPFALVKDHGAEAATSALYLLILLLLLVDIAPIIATGLVPWWLLKLSLEELTLLVTLEHIWTVFSSKYLCPVVLRCDNFLLLFR